MYLNIALFFYRRFVCLWGACPGLGLKSFYCHSGASPLVSLHVVLPSLSAEFLAWSDSCIHASRVWAREPHSVWRWVIKSPSKAGPAKGCRGKFINQVLLRTEQGLIWKCAGLPISPQAVWNEHGSPPKPGRLHLHWQPSFPVLHLMKKCQSTKFMESSEFPCSQITRLSNREGSLPWRVRTHFSDTAMGI